MILLGKIFTIILAWILVQGNNQREKLFFLQKSSGRDKETLLVVTWTEGKEESPSGCEIFRDKDLINRVLESSNGSPIQTLSWDEMQPLLRDCTEFNLRIKRRETEDDEEYDYEEYEGDDEEERGEILLKDVINEPAEATRRSSSNQQSNRNGSNQQSNRNGSNQQSNRNGSKQQSNGNGSKQQSNRSGSKQQNGRSGSKTGSKKKRAGTQTTTSANFVTFTTASPTRRNANNSMTTKRTTVSMRTTTTPPTTLGYDGVPIVYPGTRWCGAGDIARDYEHLGTYQDTDRCCRAHDNCNDTMAPGETRYNLTNKSMYTKLSCECDQEFYDCLSRVNSFTSNSIGNMYFNILRRDCYKKEYPLTKNCKSYLTLFKITCMEYERDTTAPKVYQWIPAERYKLIG